MRKVREQGEYPSLEQGGDTTPIPVRCTPGGWPCCPQPLVVVAEGDLKFAILLPKNN